MWTTNELGIACWRVGALALEIDARGGANGIRMRTAGREVTFGQVGNDAFPTVQDQFLRGDQWHVSFPQESGSFSLAALFRPVPLGRTEDENIPKYDGHPDRRPAPSGQDVRSTIDMPLALTASSTAMIMEVTLAVNTSYLDTHPMVDVFSRGGPVHRLTIQGDEPASAVGTIGCASISFLATAFNLPAIAIMIGPHDRPFTSDRSSGELRLRLFGDFLEKGVIRKARVWIAFGIDNALILEQLWENMSNQSLPLSA